MIDVLLPFYGDSRLMQQAVESVLAQSSDQWNLIVVDDHGHESVGSAWLKDLDHPRVAVHTNPCNLGVNGNFRRCLELATSPHVVFLGCDDRLRPNYVELVHAALNRHPRAGLIQPRVQIIDDHGDASAPLTDRIKSALTPKGGQEHVLFGEDLAVSLLRGVWTYFPAICWRREVLERHPFQPDLETALDLALLLDLVIDGETLVLLASEAFEYRRHRRSASSRTAMDARRFEEEKAVFRTVAPRLRELQWHRAERAARIHLTSRLHALTLMPAVIGNGDHHALKAYARHALAR